MTTTVRIDQFGCSSRKTSAQYNASTLPAPSWSRIAPASLPKGSEAAIALSWKERMLRREHSYSGGHTTEASQVQSTFQPHWRFSCSKARSLSSKRNSASFRAVAHYLSVFGVANRPEFRILDLLIPWIFVISAL